MLGRDEEYVAALERAHHGDLEGARAAGGALGVLDRDRTSRSGARRAARTGWLGRARRLVEREGRDCVEQGYLLLARTLEHAAAGDHDAAIAAGAEAVAVGERFGDADLFALAAQDQGILLIKGGASREGLGLLDEAMVAVTAGELSPMVNGFVYCGVIMGCQAAYEPRRAQEWTAALTRWCDAAARHGQLHRHVPRAPGGDHAAPRRLAGRAGGGAAGRASGARAARNAPAAAQARYRQGEVHRLRGEFAAAEEAYRDAHRGGYEPQPGLALLRLAQGNGEAAAAAIRRLAGETSEPSKRAGAAAGAGRDPAGGRRRPGSARRVRASSRSWPRHWDGDDDRRDRRARARSGRPRRGRRPGGARRAAARDAGVAGARGAVRGGARAGRSSALACRALGDDDSAALELEAAREVFARLGAAPDLARVDAPAARRPTRTA